MTRRFHSRRVGNTTIKTLDKQPIKFAAAICPLNLEEQKERFLKLGKLPKFVLKGSENEIESLFNKARNQIRFDLFGEAEYILKTVKARYGDGENYLTAQFGEKISKDEATAILEQYLRENNLDGAMSIVWCADLASSARMMWIGPHCKHNRPEARNYSFWIKNSEDNNFLREQGIRCLADHEIGTHFLRSSNEGSQPWYSDRKRFRLRDSGSIEGLTSEEGLAAIHSIYNARVQYFRSFNDGLQPWYSDRSRFDLRGRNSIEELRAEEGLAAINTILNSKVRFLWGPALLYYTACKAAEMSFKQLFDHLAIYVKSQDHRWRLCMRVKRGLLDPNDLGGYGKDQCYFEGAVEILRSLDVIDFSVMMSGKICVDEVQRCKRLARLDCLKLPGFMKNENRYKKHLKAIAHLNGLDLQHQKKNAPAAYVRRLKQGRRIGTDKVRRVHRRNCRKVKTGSPLSSNSTESTESEYDDSYYGKSKSAGGIGVSEFTPVVKYEELVNKKNPRVDSGVFSDTHNNFLDDNFDSLSNKSYDTTSVKSFFMKSDCKSIKSDLKSCKSEFSEKSANTIDSITSRISLRVDIQSRISDSLSKGESSTSIKSKTPLKYYNSSQTHSATPVIAEDAVKNLSLNNNATKVLGKKDILPPLISYSENGQKTWSGSNNKALLMDKHVVLPNSNRNICTTIISADESKMVEKGAQRTISSSKDCGRCDASEVNFPNVNHTHVVGVSSLTNCSVTKANSANQNSVFRSVSDTNLEEEECHSVVEQGPEKFIYPDFQSYFDFDFIDISNPFLSTTHTDKPVRRRAKSATFHRQKLTLV